MVQVKLHLDFLASNFISFFKKSLPKNHGLMNFKSHEFTFAVIINSLKTLRIIFKEKTMMSYQQPNKYDSPGISGKCSK